MTWFWTLAGAARDHGGRRQHRAADGRLARDEHHRG